MIAGAERTDNFPKKALIQPTVMDIASTCELRAGLQTAEYSWYGSMVGWQSNDPAQQHLRVQSFQSFAATGEIDLNALSKPLHAVIFEYHEDSQSAVRKAHG